MAAKLSTTTPPEEVIFGRTPQMARVRELLLNTNKSLPLLLQGESGTGKEVVARLIAAHSGTATNRFVKVSCPAIPAALLETELFGYEKGAFTGAQTAKRGRVELADKGIIFLDEVGELDIGVQAKLVHLFQDGRYFRVGGQEERSVELRIVCATNRNLRQQVSLGLFRSDLFYRINALTVDLPPLRDRIIDLPQLVEYFLNLYAGKFDRAPKPISAQTMRLMEHYRWPGNVRELENMVRRYVILQDEESLINDMAFEERETEENFVAQVAISSKVSLKQLTKSALQDLERQIIMRALKAHNWNRRKTADALEISYRGLLYKMRDTGFPRQSSPRHKASGLDVN